MANRISALERLRENRLRLFAAMLLIAQAMIPNGFMPVFAANGPVIMLCTGQGLQRAALPDDASIAMHALADALDESDVPETDNTPCDYAAASNIVAKLPAVAIAEAPVARNMGSFAPNGLIAIGAGLAAPPPPQTGPPLTF